MKSLKKVFYFFLLITFSTSQYLYSENTEKSVRCDFALPFLNTLKDKDFLNYNLVKKISKFFAGNNSQRAERVYSFIIKMAWKWHLVNVASPVIKTYSIENCKVEGDNATATVKFSFRHLLFFRKSFNINLPFEKNGHNRWMIKFPLLNETPLD